jgi:hypothetical protein
MGDMKTTVQVYSMHLYSIESQHTLAPSSEMMVYFFTKELDKTGFFLLKLPLKFDPLLNKREEEVQAVLSQIFTIHYTC